MGGRRWVRKGESMVFYREEEGVRKEVDEGAVEEIEKEKMS